MGTSVQMLEEYYGHTSNITMSDELTKGRGRKAVSVQKPANGKSNDDAIFSWLKDDENSEKASTGSTVQNDHSAGPSYVDLVTN